MIDLFGVGQSTTLTAWQLAWQSTALLALGLIVSSIVAMRPSRAHRILLAAALACLLVVPASLVARWLDVGLISRAPVAIAPPPASMSRAVPGLPSRPPVAVSPPLRAAVTNAGKEARPVLPDLRMDRLVPSVWGVLTAAGLLRLVASFAGGLRLKARATIVGDPNVLAAAAAAASSLGLSSVPEVRASGSVRCPVVWCWGRRPVLILPQGFASASPGARSDCLGVLCHELAHWKRRDHVSGLFSELLTCLFPWQPLAWVVQGRMGGLSELACDDWALTHARTVTPHDYAESLLGLALERRRTLVPAAVSRRSGLGVRVRHILEEAEPRPRTGLLWSTLVAGLAIALVAFLALVRTRQAQADFLERPSAGAVAEAKPTTIDGRVRGRNGEPISGVEVYCIGVSLTPPNQVTMSPGDPDYAKRSMRVLDHGTTDARGHFSLEAPVNKPTGDGPWTMLVAHKPGLAPASHYMDIDGKPIELVIEPAVRISGRLLGPGGDPAPGVTVRLEDYTEPQGEDPIAVRTMEYGGNQVWSTRPSFFPDEVRTDGAGRFVLDGFVPEGMFATVVLSGPAYATEEIAVWTGKSTGPIPEPATPGVRPLAREFTHTLAPPRPVTGRITDVETKAPLAGVRVQVTPMRKQGGRSVTTVTDSDGRYRVSDRDGETYWVSAYPARSSGYLAAVRGSIAWPEGQSELRVDMGLRRGVVLRGRVIDEDTSKPIPYASLAYQPQRGNTHVRDEDHFDSPAQSDAAGQFALTGLRGPGVVVAEAPSGDYIRRAVSPVDFGYRSRLSVHGLARLDVPANGEPPEVIIKMKRGFTLKARAVRPDGSAAELVRAWSPDLTSGLVDAHIWINEFAQGKLELTGAEPGRTYRVFFLDRDHKHGALAELKADPGRTEPIEVRLLPTATVRGRVLDSDGSPIVGAQVLANIQLVDKGSVLSEQTRFDDMVIQIYNMFTDEPLKRVYPAEFRYEGLIPGVRYFVTWYNREGEHLWRAVEPLEPGEDRDVADILPDRKEATNGN